MVGVDLISTKDGSLQGPVANRLAGNGAVSVDASRPWMDMKTGRCYIQVYIGGDPSKVESYQVQEIQANQTTLRREEWILLDEAILELSKTRLGGVEDLISHGLVKRINGMSRTVLETHNLSDSMNAVLSMDGVTRSENDRPVYEAVYLPLPIIHVDFQFNARELAISRNMGDSLDTTGAEQAADKVLRLRENMLFTDITYPLSGGTFGGGTIYSYVNTPGRNQVTLAANWDAAGKTGAQIITDVLNCKSASIAAMHYGPFMLYIPTLYETKLDEDYSTAKGSNTIRERILAIASIEGIKVIESLPANNVIMVQMTSDVVRLVEGLPMQNIQWSMEGNMVTNFKVMSIQVPQIRADQDGNSGVTHLAA